MRISFTGDDGCIERLAVVASDCESSPVIIEEISADISGRSFLLKLPGSEVSYFWCSERSKSRGVELLSKMKDLLKKKPSLSHLTGICESRIDSFANHLRAYLVGSSTHAETTSTTSSLAFDSSTHASSSDLHSSSRPSRSRLTATNTVKVHPLYQGSLSPRSSTFKDGMSKSTSYNRNATKEKLRRRGDGYSSSLAVNNLLVTAASRTTHTLSTSQPEDNSGSIGSSSDYSGSAPFCLPEIPFLSYPSSSCSHSVIKAQQSEFAVTSPPITPCYCWSPRYPSPLQYTVSSHLPIASTECLRLPPLSSLLSSKEPPVSINVSELPIDIAGLPSHKLPSLFPSTLVHFPLPIPSHSTLPCSQVPAFTPFMSDSIVHIPMIDVCSTGPGYLVSAESALSLAIPPLLPTCASPLISQSESAEMNARETLRMLMASAPPSTCPPFMTMLPQVLNSSEEMFPYAHVSKREIIAAGSRGLYSGVLDVKAVTSGLSLMTFSSSTQNLARGDLDMRISSESSEATEIPEVPGGSSFADGNLSD